MRISSASPPPLVAVPEQSPVPVARPTVTPTSPGKRMDKVRTDASGAPIKLGNPSQKTVLSKVSTGLQDLPVELQATNSIAEVSQAASSRAPKAVGEFLGLEDIFDPKSLDGKEVGKDYVLLLHKPHDDAVDQIKQTGLKSLARLNAGGAPPEFTEKKNKIIQTFSSYKFSPDPNLIYFRPVSSMYRVKKNDFVIAVRPESANVFNQENRVKAWGTPGGYKWSSMNILEYEALRKTAPPGQFINKFKKVAPFRSDDETYYPEICVKADHINTDLFFPHSKIDDALIANKYGH
jgi:hypothetical protein